MPAEKHRTHISPFGHTTHEYGLPTALPDEDRNKLPPWLAEIVDATPQRVGEILEGRWASVALPCNVLLRDRLLKFSPYSIIRFQEACYLRLCLPEADPDLTGNSFFLASPILASAAAERLQAFGLANQAEFAEFLAAFGGLRESMPPLSGHFLNGEAWMTAAQIMPESSEDFDRWRNGVVIYRARNGDCVALHVSGNVGWFQHEEGCIADPFPSFAEFLSFFVRYNVEYAYPFDSYGPADYNHR